MRLRKAELQRLLEAVEILHTSEEGPFAARLFRASRTLFAEAFHGFEIFGLHDGSHTISTDMPWPEARRAELMALASEVVPAEHPIFPRLAQGLAEPARLSDLMSRRKLESTRLFQEIFAPAHTRHQIAIPFATARYVGGLTINRGGADYSDRELAMARAFAPHVLAAHRVDQVMAKAQECVAVGRLDFGGMRARGLTRRECEVLAWVREGKSNDEIAIILAISRRTVETHLHAIFKKLDVGSRTAAARAFDP